MKFIGSIMRYIDRFSDWCFYAGAFLILVLPFIMSYEVVMRYFLNRPTTWAVDFSEYILLYSTFFAAGWLLKEGEHIHLTFVLDCMGPKNRLIMRVLQSLMGIFACGFLLWACIGATSDAIARGVLIIRPISVPKWIVLWIITFGALMLFIYFVRSFFNSLAAFKVSPVAVDQTVEGNNKKECAWKG